jgi:hypothetical protein
MGISNSANRRLLSRRPPTNRRTGVLDKRWHGNNLLLACQEGLLVDIDNVQLVAAPQMFLT